MENNYEYVQESTEKQGSIVRGVIGAVLGAIIGAALWCGVSIATEMVYSIVGFLVGLLVGFGYDLLKGRKGTIRMVVVFICVIVALIAGTLLTEAYFIHDSYMDEVKFVETATQKELIEFYCTEEELAEYNALSAPMKAIYEKTFYVELYPEEEVFQMMLQDQEYTKGVLGNCAQSVLFGLLGSFALILKNGGKEKTNATKPVNFDEAALDTADIVTLENQPADNSGDADA